MIKQIRKWFWTKVAEWKYSEAEYNEVCCCGSTIKGRGYHYGEFLDYRCSNLSCPSRCAKEYAVTSYVEGKLKN